LPLETISGPPKAASSWFAKGDGVSAYYGLQRPP
jgi:hypothetical protein